MQQAKFKKKIEKLLGRKVRLNYVNRGMGDIYHQFNVSPDERKKALKFIAKRKRKITRVNPIRNADTVIAIQF